MSAEEFAASTRQSTRVSSYDSSTAALNGKASPGNAMEGDFVNANGQVSCLATASVLACNLWVDFMCLLHSFPQLQQVQDV